MQVTETNTDGLKHEFKVAIPATEIEENLVRRLQEVGKTIRIPGFRQGKAPLKILRQRFGQSMLGEVLEARINDASSRVVADRGLRPALQPAIEVAPYEVGKDLEYTMAIEVIPDITPMDFSSLSLEKLVADVDMSEVEKTLDRLANAYRTTETVTEARPTQNGDVVEIGFVGRVDGEEFPGGKADSYRLELGSGAFIPGFEDQLVGTVTGSKVDVKVMFPSDYGAAELAGKEAVFEVNVKAIHVSKPATIDDELAKRAGKDSLEDLKEALREVHGAEFKAASRMRLKRALLDALAEAHDFPVPRGLVENEFQGIWTQFEQQKNAGQLQGDDARLAEMSEEDQKAEFRRIAERRVRLGLLLAEVGRSNNITVTNADLERAMREEARNYPGQEEAILNIMRTNPNIRDSLRAPVYEEKVVDFILELAQVNEKTVSRQELLDEEKEDAPASE